MGLETTLNFSPCSVFASDGLFESAVNAEAEADGSNRCDGDRTFDAEGDAPASSPCAETTSSYCSGSGDAALEKMSLRPPGNVQRFATNAAVAGDGKLSAGKTENADDFGLGELDIAFVEEQMRPFIGLSRAGFLGRDESLLDILRADAETLRRYGITHEEIAELLSQVAAYSRNTDHYQVKVGDERFDVDLNMYLGSQECPFFKHSDDGKYFHPHPMDWDIDIRHRAGCDYKVRNVRTGQSLEFGGLLIHLIRVHKFFEGKGTSYRLPPEDVIRFFGMERGVRSATLIETPSYLYDYYGVGVFLVLGNFLRLYDENRDSGSFTGEEGLRAFSAAIDRIAFVAPEIREDWKQRAAEIVDNLGPKDESLKASWAAKRAELDAFSSAIEAKVIRSAGFVPLRYWFDGTGALFSEDVEKFRTAKLLRAFADKVGELMKEKSRFGSSPDYREWYSLLNWADKQTSSGNLYDYPFPAEIYQRIRGTIEHMNVVMIGSDSYEDARWQLDALLEQLRNQAEAELSAARQGLSMKME